MPFSSRRLTCSWMALVLPLGASFIFFYGRKRADMGGCRRRLDGAVLGRLWALGCGLWAKMGTHRDGAATGRRGRLPYGGRVRVAVRRDVQRMRSCLGEKGQRTANQRGKRPVNKGEWGRLPRTSRGQDGHGKPRGTRRGARGWEKGPGGFNAKAQRCEDAKFETTEAQSILILIFGVSRVGQGVGGEEAGAVVG